MADGYDGPVLCPVLIGRASQVDSLHQVINQGREGHGSVVLISGEAGVGKSRLVLEANIYATSENFQVFHGNCFPQDIRSAYALFFDLLRNHFVHDNSGSNGNFSPLENELARLLPGILPTALGVDDTPSLVPETHKRQLFGVFTHYMIEQTRQRPVLVVLEDLHWSDDLSLELMYQLARQVAHERLVLTATYRSDEVDPHLRHWLIQFNRERLAREISLLPLSQTDTALMLRAILDPDHPARADFVDAIYPLTEGNPFFIEETLKSLTAVRNEGQSASEWEHMVVQQVKIPHSVGDAVEQRLMGLSEVAKRILDLAAVVGRTFDFALLHELSGIDETTLTQIVKTLIDSQFIVEVSNDRFAFRHALTREAILSGLLARAQKVLHRTIAETLERRYDEIPAVILSDLAYHTYERMLWDKAFDFARRAGDQAIAFYAPDTAIGHFTHALEAAMHLGIAPLPELYRARGLAYETLGDFNNAQEDLETALTLSASGSHIRWQVLLDLGLLWASRNYQRTGDYYQQSLAAAAAMSDQSLQSHSLNQLGNWYVNVEQPLDGLHHHQQALSLFQALDDAHGIAETLDLLGMASFRLGDWTDAMISYQQAIALFRQQEEKHALISSLTMLSVCGCTYSTDTIADTNLSISERLKAGEEAIQIARAISWRAGEAFAHLCLSWSLGMQGDYGRALADAQAGLNLAEAIEHHQWMSSAHWTLGAIYLDVFQLSPAQEHLERALTLAQQTGSMIWVNHVVGLLASTYLARNDQTRAETILNSLPPDLPTQTLGQRQCWLARAQLALALADLNSALSIVERLGTSAPNQSTNLDQTLPRIGLVRGQILTLLARWDGAEQALFSAEQGARQQGLQPTLWRIQVAQGKLYQAMQEQAAAEQVMSQARTVIQSLALNLPDDNVRATFLQSAQSMLVFYAPRSANLPANPLTAREQEVARWVAQGLSNRVIADKLVLGERTVESHVSSILSKLGFTSRTQIAAWVIKQSSDRTDTSQP